jgi:hypothetical protein
MKRPTVRRTWLALVLTLAALTGVVSSQTRAPESAVKAAYLFHFAQFVRWPPNTIAADEPFTICVIGPDPFGRTLDSTVARESIDGHPIAVKRLERASKAAGCQMAYVGNIEDERIDATLRLLASGSTLTVSDTPRFAARGGMLQFVSIDNRVRFEINLSAAEAAGLVPSSELSRVAVAVHRAPSGQ